MVLAVMSVFFTDYLDAIFHSIPKIAVSVRIILLFWLISLRGVSPGAAVQNVIVVLLFSLAIYVFTGIPHMDSAQLTPSALSPREI